MREELPILYRDEHLVAVHKPSGLLVHRTSLDRWETRFAVQILRDQLGQRVYPGHRLDKGTSGVLLFGMNPEAGRALAMAFEAQQVDKTYHALVRGWPAAEGLIDHPLERKLDDAELYGGPVPTGVQEAQTRYRTLATVTLPWQIDRYPQSRYAFLELEPLTGRRHQLRRHLKHISHPIIGDATYGKGQHNRRFAAEYGVSRMLLACSAMSFPHPQDGRRMRIASALDAGFASVLQQIAWETGQMAVEQILGNVSTHSHLE
ncbi:pseudouridine synthase [Chitinilyticum piscinae]|uniref:Pseudouridylate synthase n=1 Tax=Chitinilyticum piscinae TaxID=2866724 RepID=A0A8J7FLR0_9NEIS|nr:pseudouridine synthase [Chitinilyticum piscinae]MBE9610110.1 pseudouridylate synthase [Chitinilyticum piscinae]